MSSAVLAAQRRPPGAGAVEDECLVLGEEGLVIGAFGIDPEFEHAARDVARTRDPAGPGELADVAEVDEHDIAAPVHPERLVDLDLADLGIGLGDHRHDGFSDVLGHRGLSLRWAGRGTL